jgi:hypothetical protein
MKKLLAVLVLGLALPAPVYADDEHHDDESLRGVGPFKIIVEQLDKDARRAGLTEQALLDEVEYELRGKGLPVDNNRGSPFLYVRVGTGKGSVQQLVYDIEVSFHQYATLEASNNRFLVRSWEDVSYGFAGQKVYVQAIRDGVLKSVQGFGLAYMRTHPKVSQSKE